VDPLLHLAFHFVDQLVERHVDDLVSQQLEVRFAPVNRAAERRGVGLDFHRRLRSGGRQETDLGFQVLQSRLFHEHGLANIEGLTLA
jgi:hypothetical protein